MPKQLTSDSLIILNVEVTHKNEIVSNDSTKITNAVFIDDNERLLKHVILLSKDNKIDTYADPRDFLDQALQYDKNTKVIIDNIFDNYPETGIQVSEQLHRLGFTRFYLFPGRRSSRNLKFLPI